MKKILLSFFAILLWQGVLSAVVSMASFSELKNFGRHLTVTWQIDAKNNKTTICVMEGGQTLALQVLPFASYTFTWPKEEYIIVSQSSSNYMIRIDGRADSIVSSATLLQKNADLYDNASAE